MKANKNAIQESEPAGRQIVFRVKVAEKFEGHGAWREFEVEDLFEGGKESGTLHGAFDWSTKTPRSPWKDKTGKWLFEGDMIKQEQILINPNPDNQFTFASGIVAWTMGGFRIVPIGRLIPVPAESKLIANRFDFAKCPICDGKEKVQVKCKPECAGFKCGCIPYPNCPGMLEEPCPVCGGG